MIEKNTKSLTSFHWGMIGCGDVTEKKSAPAYQKVPGFRLAAVASRNYDKTLAYSHRHKIETVFKTIDELIQNDSIDAIYIATPPDSHKRYALQVANAGKPCCLEKPMAPSYQECREIYEAFAKNNLPLFVAYYRRSLPRFLQVKEWLDSNKIGIPRHITWHYRRFPSTQDLAGEPNWRTQKAIAHAGYFDDLASHGLDLFDFLLGKIVDVSGFSVNQQQLYTSDDAVAGSWIHQSNTFQGLITGSGVWNFGAADHEDQVTIIGSNGQIEFSVFQDMPIHYKNNTEQQSLLVENPENIQFFHVQNMYDHLRGKRQHPSTGESAMQTAWVMDKMLGRL